MPSVALVLTDSFPILSLTLVTEPLRVANRELARAGLAMAFPVNVRWRGQQFQRHRHADE